MQSVVITSDQENRLDFKKRLLGKIETALTPPSPELEPDPIQVEIIEKYSKWVPARFALEPEELLPDFKKEESFVPHREIEKRADIKNDLLKKIEASLNPIEIVSEPVKEAQIIDKFANGIPQRSMTDADPVFPEARRILKPVALNTDTASRVAFKNRLLKKIETARINEPNLDNNIEIVDYSQRTISSYGLDFEEAKVSKIIVSEPNEEVIIASAPVEAEPLILRLPENFQDLNEKALYGLLIRDPELMHSSESANLTLDILAQRTPVKAEFIVISKPKLEPVQVPVKTARVLEDLPVLKVEILEPVMPMAKEPELVEFDLPSDWKTIPLSVLRTDLLATGATPEQVDAKLAYIVKKESKSPSPKKTETQELSINLPSEFNSWKPNSQYLYLTKELKLTPEQANGVIWEHRLEN